MLLSLHRDRNKEDKSRQSSQGILQTERHQKYFKIKIRNKLRYDGIPLQWVTPKPIVTGKKNGRSFKRCELIFSSCILHLEDAT